MIITVTYIHLRSFWSFFTLANHSRKILGQLKSSPGHLKYRARGFGKKHYTISLWESQEAMRKFARSGAHLKAMKASASLAQEIRTYTYEGESLPSWKEAKQMLQDSGKVLSYT